MGLKNRLVISGVFAVLGASMALLLDHLFPPNTARLHTVSVIFEDTNGQTLRVFSTPEGLLRLNTKAHTVDDTYLRFLKSFEDKRYDQHFGVDPLALLRATGQWAASGKIISGGSTLTMQVARLLEPRPRTLRSKALEILRALQLEWHFSKSEILDAYVTLAPFGGRLEGLSSASLSYFQKLPAHLTIAEAALLVALPQSPSKLRPDRFPERAKNARRKVLDRLLETGDITLQDYKEAISEPIPEKLYALPMLAPHLADRLVIAQPGQSTITSSIDAFLQSQTQELVRAYAKTIGNTVSVAVLIVENKSRLVRTHIGSNHYTDTYSQGFVDMTHAARSPGSTLKPLIYALSFDDHQSHPQTLIWDRPDFDTSYRPANFDRIENGQVTIADALRQSLNIPAVKVLDRFGPIRFRDVLNNNGITLKLPNNTSKPSTAMALGGVGVTLEDLVTAYSALASDRKICPLRFTHAERQPLCPSKAALISPQTQHWITGILGTVPRPDGYTFHAAPNLHTVNFKTGTSYGHRDAWAIGYNKTHTIGVWIGDPTGRPVPGQTGLQTAAPLLFSLFEKVPVDHHGHMPSATSSDWRASAPENLKVFRKNLNGSMALSTRALDIVYPFDETAFLFSDVSDTGILLKAQNGKRPLIWTINGTPLSSSRWKRETRWQPSGPGFYEIMVLDRTAETSRRWIEIRE